MKNRLTTPALGGARYRALLELLRTAESLWNASRIFFARWDLGPSQFNVLNLLADLPQGCTQVELSRQLIMHLLERDRTGGPTRSPRAREPPRDTRGSPRV